MSLPDLILTYRGCRCGRIVVAPQQLTNGREGMWCPSAEAGIHDFMTPYPF